ncbi:MAG: HD domain-containing protein [Chloroflexi bacterium]|nr:HD domain-containing protein [Chloroflexota bacterium]
MTTTNHAAHVRQTFARELAEVRDDALREKVVRTWVRSMEASGAHDLEHDLPFTSRLHKPGLGVEHVRAVVRLALAMADVVAAVHGVAVDRDAIAAGALLHDVGKLLEHAPAGQHALAGSTLGHAFSGVHLAAEEGLPHAVLHIIAYHSLEGQRLRRSTECEIVYRADFTSFEMLARRELGQSGHEVLPYVYLPPRL